tara:strand:+ start:568 stop:945 length:378 start_codon:yes stop_codon:yes gene_type:complete
LGLHSYSAIPAQQFKNKQFIILIIIIIKENSMAKVITVDVPPNTWVDVNTVSGIAVGSSITIQNVSTVWVNIQESSSEPTEEREGKIITNLDKSSAEALVKSGSDKIWVRSTQEDRGAVVAVQEV